jgi:hypothetical protein
MTWSRHDQVSMRLIGPAPDRFGTAGLPEQVVLHRGFRNTFDARVRAVRTIAPWFKLALTLRMETSAVPRQAVNPAAVDGFKIEPAVAAQIRIGSSFMLAAGYAFTIMPAVSTGESAFNPASAVACGDARGDLENPACQDRLAGKARPTAAGRYRQTTHALSLSLTARF